MFIVNARNFEPQLRRSEIDRRFALVIMSLLKELMRA